MNKTNEAPSQTAHKRRVKAAKARSKWAARRGKYKSGKRGKHGAPMAATDISVMVQARHKEHRAAQVRQNEVRRAKREKSAPPHRGYNRGANAQRRPYIADRNPGPDGRVPPFPGPTVSAVVERVLNPITPASYWLPPQKLVELATKKARARQTHPGKRA